MSPSEKESKFELAKEILTNRERWAIQKRMESFNRKRKLRKLKNRAKRKQKYGGGK